MAVKVSAALLARFRSKDTSPTVLHCDGFADAAIEDFAISLKQQKTLRELRLEGPSFGDSEIKQILEALKGSALEKLQLVGVSCKDGAQLLHFVVATKSLSALEFTDVDIPVEVKESIRQELRVRRVVNKEGDATTTEKKKKKKKTSSSSEISIQQPIKWLQNCIAAGGKTSFAAAMLRALENASSESSFLSSVQESSAVLKRRSSKSLTETEGRDEIEETRLQALRTVAAGAGLAEREEMLNSKMQIILEKETELDADDQHLRNREKEMDTLQEILEGSVTALQLRQDEMRDLETRLVAKEREMCKREALVDRREQVLRSVEETAIQVAKTRREEYSNLAVDSPDWETTSADSLLLRLNESERAVREIGEELLSLKLTVAEKDLATH